MNGNGTFVFSPENHNMWVIALILAMLASAVCIELVRRHLSRRKLIAAEWRALRQLLKDRECTPAQRQLLETVIDKHAPEKPYRAATARPDFDACVSAHLAEVERKGDAKLYEERGAMLHDIRVRLRLDYIPFGRRIHSTRELYHQQHMWMAAEPAASADNWFRMSVLSVDEAHFYLRPEGGASPPKMKPGKEVRFRMWREEDGRYLFAARLVRVESAPVVYMFRHSQELERTQSRAHFRVRYEHTGNISLINAPVDGDFHDLEKRQTISRVRGRFTSLSAGGFAVIVPQAVPRQVLLRTSLELEEGTAPVDVYARLVAVQPIQGGEYLLRAAFVELLDEDADRIAHYTFERQQAHHMDEPEHSGSSV